MKNPAQPTSEQLIDLGSRGVVREHDFETEG